MNGLYEMDNAVGSNPDSSSKRQQLNTLPRLLLVRPAQGKRLYRRIPFLSAVMPPPYSFSVVSPLLVLSTRSMIHFWTSLACVCII